MAKSESKKPAKDEADKATEGEAAPETKKKGIFAILGAKKKLVMMAAAALLVIGGGGAAAYLFLFSGEEVAPTEEAASSGEHAQADGAKADAGGGHGAPAAQGGGGHGEAAAAHGGVPGAPLFFDLPAILVNLRSDDKPIFLKLVVSLEVKDEETLKGVEAVLPRVVDQFQTYLRELRVDELSGSAATFRLKEELLRRVKIAASPMEIQDVLFKDMIVQ